MKTCLACSTLLALGCFSAQAAVLIGNMPPSTSNLTANLNTTARRAIVFTMPSIGYTVDSVVLPMSGYKSAVDTLAVGFFASDGALPGSQVGSFLINPASASDTAADFTFVPDGTITLAANATYWFVVDVTVGSVGWKGSTSDTPTSRTPSGEAEFVSNQFSNNNGTSYASNASIPTLQVNATVVPEPAEYAAMAGLGLLGFAVWRKKRAVVA